MASKTNDPLALLQYLSNGSSDTSKSDARQLNYLQDALSSVFSPTASAAYGMFDPMSLSPAPFNFATPVLTGSLNSATPVWQQVAQQLLNGTIDRQGAISAVAESLGVDEYSASAGLTIADIKSQIDSIIKEIGDRQNAEFKYQDDLRSAEQSNIYGKAGLPQPYEEYTAETAPYSKGVFDRQSELQKMISLLSASEGKQRGVVNADTQAIYEKMMAEDKASQDAIPDKLMPESWSDAKRLAKTLGVSEGWMKGIYDKSFGLGTVQVYDQESKKYSSKVYTPDEKKAIFKNLIQGEINRGTSGTGSLVDDWFSGNSDERGVKVNNYLNAGVPKISGKRNESVDQAGRRGIAMSYEAEKQSKNKNKESSRRAAGERFAAESKARELDFIKMAELMNLRDAGRTPTTDAISQRMALFGLGNNL